MKIIIAGLGLVGCKNTELCSTVNNVCWIILKIKFGVGFNRTLAQDIQWTSDINGLVMSAVSHDAAAVTATISAKV